MKNTLPKSKSGLIATSTVVVEALSDHAGAIGLLHVSVELVEQQLAELILACGNYDAGKLEMTARKEVLRPLATAARAFSMTTRDVLKPHLGNKYGEAWNGTGFVHSLTVPSLAPELQPLLLSLANYLTLRPGHENALLNITATRAQALSVQIGAARSAVLAQEAVLKGVFDVREEKALQLRRTLRMLLDEMGMKLSPLDPRWTAFGFNMPGKKQRPEAPTNITVERITADTMAVKWDKAPRATHYRVRVKVAGLDEEARVVGTPADTDFTLETLPADSDVEFTISAVNETGESRPSEVVAVRVKKNGDDGHL